MNGPALDHAAEKLAAPRSFWRRHGLLLLKAALSLFVLGLIVRSVDLRATVAVLQRIHFSVLVTTTLLLASSVALIVPRWRAILLVFGHSVPWHILLPSVYSGFLFNQVLPTAIGGDVLRVHSAVQAGVPLWRAASSVIVDRITGIVGAVILLLVGTTITASDGGAVLPIAVVAGGLAGTTLLGLLAVGHLPRLPLAWADRMLQPFQTLSLDLWSCLTDRKQGVRIVGLAILAQLIPVSALYLIANGSGLSLSPTCFLVLGPLTMLVSTIPLSFAGWGMREGALVFLLAKYGVPASDALAISIVFGALILIASLPGLAAIIGPAEPA